MTGDMTPLCAKSPHDSCGNGVFFGGGKGTRWNEAETKGLRGVGLRGRGLLIGLPSHGVHVLPAGKGHGRERE